LAVILGMFASFTDVFSNADIEEIHLTTGTIMTDLTFSVFDFLAIF
jgi:hypothetical protein